MPRYVALLRAVNVGGTGKLPMNELKSICTAAGFTGVETYIASGNVVFNSALASPKVKAELERRLHKHMGKATGVIVRTATEFYAAFKANPFRKSDPKSAYIVFLDAPVPKSALTEVKGQSDEEIKLGKREIYICYPGGMGRSKLKIPAAAAGTARNLNTVEALVDMAAKS